MSATTRLPADDDDDAYLQEVGEDTWRILREVDALFDEHPDVRSDAAPQ